MGCVAKVVLSAMKQQINQKELVFYKLYTAYKENPQRWVAAWEFVGEIFVKELGKWALMSYKTPANGVAIFFENPGLILRKKTRGKSGALYYEYRICDNPGPEKIVDKALYDFYQKLKKSKKL